MGRQVGDRADDVRRVGRGSSLSRQTRDAGAEEPFDVATMDVTLIPLGSRDESGRQSMFMRAVPRTASVGAGLHELDEIPQRIGLAT
jgi:hypothetical protein